MSRTIDSRAKELASQTGSVVVDKGVNVEEMCI